MQNGRFWPSYTAGALLGLVLLASFFITGRGLGASSAVTMVAGKSAHVIFPEFIAQLRYFARYMNVIAPLINWSIFLMLGLLLGSLAGSLATGNFKVRFDKAAGMSVGRRLLTAFSGGLLIGFAARLARGCSSGVALSGGAQLAIGGWVFVMAMFAAGFLTAALFRRLWS